MNKKDRLQVALLSLGIGLGQYLPWMESASMPYLNIANIALIVGIILFIVEV